MPHGFPISLQVDGDEVGAALGHGQARGEVVFDEGENVRVINGPFANFSGVVADVKPEKEKVRAVSVSCTQKRPMTPAGPRSINR